MHRPATCCVCSLTHATSTFRRGVHAGLRDAQAIRGFRFASKQRRDQQGSTARSSDREILRRTFRRQCQIGAVHVAGGRPRVQARRGHHQYQLAQLPLSEGHLYSATKAALESLTISLSRELGPAAFGSSLPAPGMVDTQMLRANNRPEALNAMIERNVLRRIGKADEIAAVVAFLATHDAGFLTDETVHINGGQRL